MMRDHNHMGRRLTYYREAAGLTIEELAERARVSLAFIQQVEAGEIVPVDLMLRFLAAALGITPAELTRDEPAPPKPVQVWDPAEDTQ